MVTLKWGWIRQKVAYRFRPSLWKKRYMVLTTMSIHLYKSERGVISALFPENTPTVHVWSDFRSVKADFDSRSNKTFLIEPKDSQSQTLKFKCVNSEDRNGWLQVIQEQLRLDSQVWSYNTAANATQDVRYALERPIMTVARLDQRLDQLQTVDTAAFIQQKRELSLSSSDILSVNRVNKQQNGPKRSKSQPNTSKLGTQIINKE